MYELGLVLFGGGLVAMAGALVWVLVVTIQERCYWITGALLLFVGMGIGVAMLDSACKAHPERPACEIVKKDCR